MSLDRLVLIIVCVICAAGVSLWLASLLFAAWSVPFLGFAFIPVGLVAYIVVRLIGERMGNRAEDHYDKMDH